MSPLLRFNPDEKNLPLLEHLEELRTRLIRCILAVMLGCLAGYFLAPPVIEFLLHPLQNSGLVARETRFGKVVVDGEGSWRFVNMDELTAAPPERPWMSAAPRDGEGWSLQRLEFYRDGDAVPFASFDSAKTSGVVYLTPLAPFLVQIKTAVIIGILLALPVILYNLYAFLAPGLFVSERRVLVPILAASLILFPAGAAFAYWMFRFALMFLAEFAADEAYLFNDIQAYLNLALTTMLAFGVLFQLPVVVVVLTRLGIVSVDTLTSKRRHIIVIIAIVAAVVTPPDPFTMIAVGLPMYLLFEISLLLARMGRSSNPSRSAAAQGEG